MPARRLILLVSLGCFVAALWLPGIAPRESNLYGFEGYSGFMCLVFGWAAVFGGWNYILPWTANIVYVAALMLWLLPERPSRWGALVVAVAITMATWVFRIDSVMVSGAGNRAASQPGTGALLWIASFLVLAVGFMIGTDAGRRPARPAVPSSRAVC